MQAAENETHFSLLYFTMKINYCLFSRLFDRINSNGFHPGRLAKKYVSWSKLSIYVVQSYDGIRIEINLFNAVDINCEIPKVWYDMDENFFRLVESIFGKIERLRSSRINETTYAILCWREFIKWWFEVIQHTQTMITVVFRRRNWENWERI